MKKILALLLALLMIFSLAACDLGTNDDDDDDDCKHRDKDSDGYCDKCDEEMDEDDKDDDDDDDDGNGTATGGDFAEKLLLALGKAQSVTLKFTINEKKNHTYWYDVVPEGGTSPTPTLTEEERENYDEVTLTISRNDSGSYDLYMKDHSVYKNHEGSEETYDYIIYFIDGVAYEYYEDENVYLESYHFELSMLAQAMIGTIGNPYLSDEDIVNELANLIDQALSIAQTKEGKGKVEIDLAPTLNEIVSLAISISADTKVSDIIDKALEIVGEKTTATQIINRLEELSGMTVSEAIKALNSDLDKIVDTDLDRLCYALIGNPEIKNMLANALAEELGGDTYNKIMALDGRSFAKLIAIFVDTDGNLWDVVSEYIFGGEAPSREEFFAELKKLLSLSVSEFEEQTDIYLFSELADGLLELNYSKLEAVINYETTSKGALKALDVDFLMSYDRISESFNFEDKTDRVSVESRVSISIENISDSPVKISLPEGAREKQIYEGYFDIYDRDGNYYGHANLYSYGALYISLDQGCNVTVNTYDYATATDNDRYIIIGANHISSFYVNGDPYDYADDLFIGLELFPEERKAIIDYADLDSITGVCVSGNYTIFDGGGEAVGIVHIDPSEIWIEYYGKIDIYTYSYTVESYEDSVIRVTPEEIEEILFRETGSYGKIDPAYDIVIKFDANTGSATVDYHPLTELLGFQTDINGYYNILDDTRYNVGSVTVDGDGVIISYNDGEYRGITIECSSFVRESENTITIPGQNIIKITRDGDEQSFNTDSDIYIELAPSASEASVYYPELDYITSAGETITGSFPAYNDVGTYLGTITFYSDGSLDLDTGDILLIANRYRSADSSENGYSISPEDIYSIYNSARNTYIEVDSSYAPMFIVNYDEGTVIFEYDYIESTILLEAAAGRTFDIFDATNSLAGTCEIYDDLSAKITMNGNKHVFFVPKITAVDEYCKATVPSDGISAYYDNTLLDTYYGDELIYEFDFAQGTCIIKYPPVNAAHVYRVFFANDTSGNSLGQVDIQYDEETGLYNVGMSCETYGMYILAHVSYTAFTYEGIVIDPSSIEFIVGLYDETVKYHVPAQYLYITYTGMPTNCIVDYSFGNVVQKS